MTTATLDPRYSDPEAEATSWADAQRELEAAKAYWFTTVRWDARPHVTTVAAVWANDAVYVVTGVDEQKAKNLEQNQHCVITTGCNTFEGLDVVVEAHAEVETDPTRLQAMADAYRAKYDDMFPYEVRDGRLRMDVPPVDAPPGEIVAYRLEATKAFGFAKGPFSQTRWTF
jgi:general stress protein 26